MLWMILAAVNIFACGLNVYAFVKGGSPANAAVAVSCGLIALMMSMYSAAEWGQMKKKMERGKK